MIRTSRLGGILIAGLAVTLALPAAALAQKGPDGQPPLDETSLGPALHYVAEEDNGCVWYHRPAGTDVTGGYRVSVDCPVALAFDAERRHTVALEDDELLAYPWDSFDIGLFSATVPGWDGGFYDWTMWLDPATGRPRVAHIVDADGPPETGKDGQLVFRYQGESISSPPMYGEGTPGIILVEELANGRWTVVDRIGTFHSSGMAPGLNPVRELIPDDGPTVQAVADENMAVVRAFDWVDVDDFAFDAAARQRITGAVDAAFAGLPATERAPYPPDSVFLVPMEGRYLVMPVLWGDRPHPVAPMFWCESEACQQMSAPLDLSVFAGTENGTWPSLTYALRDGHVLFTQETGLEPGAAVFRVGETTPLWSDPAARRAVFLTVDLPVGGG